MTIVDGPGRYAPPPNVVQADTLRLLFTYTIAFVVVCGGGIMLLVTRGDPGASDLQVIAAGFIGSALTFVFGQETSARTARQSTAATLAATVPTPPVPPAP